jgi:hypothetical protein
MVARPTATTASAKATDRASAHPAPALAAVAGDPYVAPPRTAPALDGAAEGADVVGGASARGHYDGEIESSPGAVVARAAAAATAAAAAAAIALPAGRYRSAAAFMQAAFEARLHEVETSVAATVASSPVANTASQAEAGGLSAASDVQSDGFAGRQRSTQHGSPPSTRRSKEHAPAQHSPRSGALGAAGATDTAAGLNAPVAAWDQARRGIIVAATTGGAFANRDNADIDADAPGGFGMRTAQDVFDALVRDRAARSTT